jgi:hypothetical protein
MRRHSRIVSILKSPGISMAFMLVATSASVGQPAIPSAESVTVDGARSGAVNRFVQAAATPTHIAGKMARWEIPVCPYALGMPEDTLARVVRRVKSLAEQGGVRVNSNPDCRSNIVIAFTSTPQALLDNIRKDHAAWLGYHAGAGELNRLSTVTRPIQAWYSTATIDLQGRHQNDAPRSGNGRGLEISAPCILIGGGGKTPGNGSQGNGYRDPNFMCSLWMPDAVKTGVEASRLADGLRASFDHVTIIANPLAMQASQSAIEDYIALLALAQINSLDSCQGLPSISNLLVRDCAGAAKSITDADLAYLKALYAADATALPEMLKQEIARRMEQAMAGH